MEPSMSAKQAQDLPVLNSHIMCTKNGNVLKNTETGEANIKEIEMMPLVEEQRKVTVHQLRRIYH